MSATAEALAAALSGNKRGNQEFNTFIRGIITEASPLNFPENASIDEENFVLKRTGIRELRLGMDYEEGYVLKVTGVGAEGFGELAITAFTWRDVEGDATQHISVVQTGNVYEFFDATGTSISANSLGTISIGANGSIESQYAVILGKLLIIHGDDRHVHMIEYDGSTFTDTEVDIKIRDGFGIESFDDTPTSLEADTRPTGILQTTHRYNLLNQGWPYESTEGFPGLAGAAPMTGTKWPSNSDNYLSGRYVDVSSGVDGRKQWSATQVESAPQLGLVPRGKFIIDAFNRGNSRAAKYNSVTSGTGTFNLDQSEGALKTVAAYAGRTWVAGEYTGLIQEESTSPTYTGAVFYSQSVISKDHIGKCYVEQDPTSEDASVLATDGGFISIPECNVIFKLQAMGRHLVVFADTGIWAIYGSDSGFHPTDFQILKISEVGIKNPRSIVDLEGSLMFWAEGGIYFIGTNENGIPVSQNVSENTVHTLYLDDISDTAKLYSRGFYNKRTKTVHWLYNDEDDYDGIVFKYKYNKELVFDASLTAFYKNSISSLASGSPYVCGITENPIFQATSATANVVAGTVSDLVQTATSEQVIFDAGSVLVAGDVSNSYIVYVPGATYSITFGKYTDTTFRDWVTKDSVGVTYTGFLETGYDTLNDIATRKLMNYLTTSFERTEDGFVADVNGDLEPTNQSGCTIFVKWDFADHSNSGKFSTSFQAYRLLRKYIPVDANDNFDYGQSVITTKNKVRGRGRSLSIRFQSDAGKNCKIIGWSFNVKEV